MTAKVLLVDDEPLVLEGIQRQLRKSVDVVTAVGGAAGLDAIRDNGPFAVIVSDMRMPDMDGPTFLAAAREKSPDSVRMVLSGQAELDSAIDAVNFGGIFRFLLKPCPPDVLKSALQTAIEQYDLVLAKRELLEQTLQGTVEVLNDILSLTNPSAQSRANRIARYAREISLGLGLPDHWQVRLAILLSQIGCITLPDQVLECIDSGQPLDEESEAMYRSHPDIAQKLLSRIPRLEGVAEIVGHQLEDADFSGKSDCPDEWTEVFAGSVVLRVATALDDFVQTGSGGDAARQIAAKLSLPQCVTAAIAGIQIAQREEQVVSIGIVDLRIGMTLEEDLMSLKGMRLIPKGQEITESLLLRLKSIAEGVGISEPFRVRARM